MEEQIQLVVIEDNKAFAVSLQNMIEISENMVCQALYSRAEDCLDALKLNRFPQADIILLDLNLPGKNGLTLVPTLRQNLPDA